MKILWSEEAEIALQLFYTEHEILSGKRVADARIEAIAEMAEILVDAPETGDLIVIGNRQTNDRLLSCFGGYLIYQIQGEIIYILLYIRTIDLPDVLKQY